MPLETSLATVMISRGYKFALDPTPRQARIMAAHVGARRYAFNWAHERISAAAAARLAQAAAGETPSVTIPGRFELGPEWTVFKKTATGCRRCRRLLALAPDGTWADARTGSTLCGEAAQAHEATTVACERCCAILRENGAGRWLDGGSSPACTGGPAAGEPHDPGSEFMAWVGGVSTGTIQAAIRDVAGVAWPRYLAGKARRPKYKKRGKCRESFQVHSLLRLEDATHVTLPKIGRVTVMSDDSLHPAMRRSRTRSAPGRRRHMGNRRRARMLWRQASRAAAQASALGPLLRDAREDAGLTPVSAVTRLNEAADARAADAAVLRAAELMAAANSDLELAGDDEAARDRALGRLRYAQRVAAQAPARKASRAGAWTERKLSALERTGVSAGPEQAGLLCEAYGLAGERRDTAMALAAQARIVRGTVSLGADGIWWLSLNAEIPYEVRRTPSRAQRAGGLIGVDFGVREIMTCSDGVKIANPRHLDTVLAELRVAQRRLSRCQPGSHRREKARRTVGLIHADVARMREAALHRATTELVRRHDVIAAEGWHVQAAARYRTRGQVRRPRPGDPRVPASVRHDRNRDLADAGIGMARQMLKYKGQRLGVEVLVTGPDAATGRTCSVDGTVRTTPLSPYQEVFTSDACPHRLDRRQNSARVLAVWAWQQLEHRPATRRPGKASPRERKTARRPQGRRGQLPMTRAASTRPRRGETGTPGG